MTKWHDDRMERSMASRLDRAKERARQDILHRLRDNQSEVANRIAMKLIDSELLETTSKAKVEEQLIKALEQLNDMEEWDVHLFTAPYREIVHNPNFAILYLTTYVVEKLINHEAVVDVFGSDEDVYRAIASVVEPFLIKKKKGSHD